MTEPSLIHQLWDLLLCAGGLFMIAVFCVSILLGVINGAMEREPFSTGKDK